MGRHPRPAPIVGEKPSFFHHWTCKLPAFHTRPSWCSWSAEFLPLSVVCQMLLLHLARRSRGLYRTASQRWGTGALLHSWERPWMERSPFRGLLNLGTNAAPRISARMFTRDYSAMSFSCSWLHVASGSGGYLAEWVRKYSPVTLRPPDPWLFGGGGGGVLNAIWISLLIGLLIFCSFWSQFW